MLLIWNLRSNNHTVRAALQDWLLSGSYRYSRYEWQRHSIQPSSDLPEITQYRRVASYPGHTYALSWQGWLIQFER